jgi:hypothetical protein
MADRKTTLRAFTTYKSLSVGNKHLNDELADDIVTSINAAFEALDEIDEGRKKKVVDFDKLKILASNAMAYANSGATSVARAIDGSVAKASSPAAKALARAIGDLRTAAMDIVKVLDKEFASNKTVQADAALPKEVGAYAKKFEQLVEAHALHLSDVRTLQLELKKCIDGDKYAISKSKFLESYLKAHKPKGVWSAKLCSDLVNALQFQVNSDRRDKEYGGYGGRLIEILPGFNGLFAFASPAVVKAYQKYKVESEDATDTITAGEQLIHDMCKRMVKLLEDKKTTLEKSEKKQ